MTESAPLTTQFFMSAPTECPYLPDRLERKLFTHLNGRQASPMHNALAQYGFRRSQSLVYRPACEFCSACISVRVLAQDFLPSRRFRRVQAKNADIFSAEAPAKATIEQFEIFRDYLTARHAEGGMAEMDFNEFEMMVEDSPVETQLINYFLCDQNGEPHLIGAAITDRLDDGYSMVYSFFKPELSQRSLGTFIILDHIARAKALGLDYIYLGYWVDGSAKMDYKTQFQPLEKLVDTRTWVPFETIEF